MEKVIIYGCGTTGRTIYNLCKEKYEVLAFTDSNEHKWGGVIQMSDGEKIQVVSPLDLVNYAYNKIILASMLFTDRVVLKDISETYHIPLNMFSDEYLYRNELRLGGANIARENFLRYESKLLQPLQGAVAEGGVYAGEFAAIINEVFPDRKLHLFDTFEGFDRRDIEVERTNNFSDDVYDEGFLSIKGFSLDKLLGRMPHPDNVAIHKGYFPDTTVGDNELDQEKFVFVNLDFDLYKPTKAGLEFFYSRLVQGGIILIHDYFSESLLGPSQAVNEFVEICHAPCFAIGDGICVAIMKL